MILNLEARIDPSNVPSYVTWLIDRKDYDYGRLGVLVQALGEFHKEAQLYDVLAKWPNPGDLSKLGDVWFRPALGTFRKDPRFIQVMARTPVLKYWKSSGHWPDFCYAPDLPYDCKKEAAKLNT